MNKYIKSIEELSKDIEELVTPKDVQKVFRCSLPYVYKLAETKRLRCVRIPSVEPAGRKRKNVIRFRKQDVMDFIDDNLS
jgi:hypothetical protein